MLKLITPLVGSVHVGWVVVEAVTVMGQIEIAAVETSVTVFSVPSFAVAVKL